MQPIYNKTDLPCHDLDTHNPMSSSNSITCDLLLADLLAPALRFEHFLGLALLLLKFSPLGLLFC